MVPTKMAGDFTRPWLQRPVRLLLPRSDDGGASEDCGWRWLIAIPSERRSVLA